MPKLKNRFMDEVLRIVRRFMRLELCAVDKVNWHEEPNDKKFNTVDVIMRDRADKEDPNPLRKQLPVLQNLLGGHCGGYNWNPRVGDLVWVFFYGGRQGIVLANAWGWHQYPVCRPSPYDIADKNGQWQYPFRDKYGDFVRQPYPKLKKPYCFRWFHGPAITTGSSGPGRDWAWILDYCKEGDAKPECDGCDNIDCISREGNRGFKFYSQQTQSEVAAPYRDLFFSECGSFQMFESKECSGASEIFTRGRGYWTIQGATEFQELQGHVRHYPDGTMEIHSTTEWEDYPEEATGARCIVTGPTSKADWSWQIKDFLTNAYAQAFKDGKILIESPTEIELKAPKITLNAPLTEETGNNQVDGACAHGSCSCPCSGAGGGVTCPTTSIKLDAATGRCMTREPTGEWTCLGDKVLTSVCCQNANNIVGCDSATGIVWKHVNDIWYAMSSSPTISQVCMGSDGCMLARGLADNALYVWDGVDSWDAEGNYAHDIAARTASEYYMVGYNHAGYGHAYMFDGATWAELDTTDIDKISVAPDGALFAILHSDGSLVKWSGTAWGSSLGAATGLKQIAAKSGTMVWAVGADDTLYYWNGLTWVQSSTETVSALALAMM